MGRERNFSFGFLGGVFGEVGIGTEGSVGEVDVEGWVSGFFVREVCGCVLESGAAAARMRGFVSLSGSDGCWLRSFGVTVEDGFI